MFLSRRTVHFLTFVTAGILITLLSIFIISQSSVEQAKKETRALIELDYPIESIEQFYWLTTPEETYFSLEFITSEEEPLMYGIVAQEGGDTFYYSEHDIISHDEAISITISENENIMIRQARLGLLYDDPVWEVTFNNQEDIMTYYYINAKNGKWIETITNF